MSGVIELAAEETGWLVAVARIGHVEVFRGYVERPYEQYEIWPPHAGLADGEAPGRIGKRTTWVSFAAASWPARDQASRRDAQPLMPTGASFELA